PSTRSMAGSEFPLFSNVDRTSPSRVSLAMELDMSQSSRGTPPLPRPGPDYNITYRFSTATLRAPFPGNLEAHADSVIAPVGGCGETRAIRKDAAPICRRPRFFRAGAA